MAGTYPGGVKAAATNKQLYGDNFYVKIGKAGGSRTHRRIEPKNLIHRLAQRLGLAPKYERLKKGFAADPQRAKEAGRKGGQISKRRKK